MPISLFLVLSAPSGAGKSTLCRALLDKSPSLRYSVSCTTRAPRNNEVSGREYVFLPEAEFKKRIEADAFVEWARVHDNYYGTPKQPLLDARKDGADVLFDLDPQGALALRKAFPETVCVFVTPPSWEDLEGRLRGRAQDDEAAIAKRLANARKEVEFLKEYDYLVVNKDLPEAVKDLSAILRAEHRRLARLAQESGSLLAGLK